MSKNNKEFHTDDEDPSWGYEPDYGFGVNTETETKNPLRWVAHPVTHVSALVVCLIFGIVFMHMPAPISFLKIIPGILALFFTVLLGMRVVAEAMEVDLKKSLKKFAVKVIDFVCKPVTSIVLVLIMASCDKIPQGDSRQKTNDNYTIVTIDGCEYLEYDQGILAQRVYSLTHKGNCKNEIHKK